MSSVRYVTLALTAQTVKPRLHDTTGCQRVVQPVRQPAVSYKQTSNRLSNRIVQPAWQRVWQQVVSCKRGLRDINLSEVTDKQLYNLDFTFLYFAILRLKLFKSVHL